MLLGFDADEEAECDGLLRLRTESEGVWITGANMDLRQKNSSSIGPGESADECRESGASAFRSVQDDAGCSASKSAGRCTATACAGQENRAARTKPTPGIPSHSGDCGNFLLISANTRRVAPARIPDAGEPSPEQQGGACAETRRPAGEGFVFTSMCLPRHDLLCVAPMAKHKLEIGLDRSPAIRHGIVGYLTLLGDVGATLDLDSQKRLEQHTLDMVGLLLNNDALRRAPVPPVVPIEARLRLVERDIKENLTDPQLSISKVAARLGIHPKQVQRLFAARGRTFADFVLDERLALARRKLAEGHGAAEKISTIAFDVGFGDLAYFNRAFRSRFGQTPSEYRTLSIAA